jgi:membrane protein DedA with SNARE-associated domain
VFDQFTHLVAEASLWAYVVVFLFSAIDAVLPIVPSETAVITAGVVASSGDLFLPIVIGAAALGAFAGDNLAYFLGRRYGARIKERFFSGEKAKRRVAWAERQLTERGGELIAIGRFIPGGRTAVTLSAGTLRFPWHRFAFFDAIAAIVWALYAALLGFFGGRAFEGSAWKGLVVAFAIALAVTGGIEVVRWFMKRRGSRSRT